jgi:hypothetical protein
MTTKPPTELDLAECLAGFVGWGLTPRRITACPLLLGLSSVQRIAGQDVDLVARAAAADVIVRAAVARIESTAAKQDKSAARRVRRATEKLLILADPLRNQGKPAPIRRTEAMEILGVVRVTAAAWSRNYEVNFFREAARQLLYLEVVENIDEIVRQAQNGSMEGQSSGAEGEKQVIPLNENLDIALSGLFAVTTRLGEELARGVADPNQNLALEVSYRLVPAEE